MLIRIPGQFILGKCLVKQNAASIVRSFKAITIKWQSWFFLHQISRGLTICGKPKLEQVICRSFANSPNNLLQYSKACYREIKDLRNHPGKMLIDVREPEEIEHTGRIPTSINIPLGAIVSDLNPHFEANKFEAKYGRKKPNQQTELIFTCRSGSRSRKAAELALALGYRNVKNYEGWDDWVNHEGWPK